LAPHPPEQTEPLGAYRLIISYEIPLGITFTSAAGSGLVEMTRPLAELVRYLGGFDGTP